MIFDGPSFLVLALISRGEETMGALLVGVRQLSGIDLGYLQMCLLYALTLTMCHFFLAELQHLRIASWEFVSLLLPAP
jgi:hypothetical protein